MDRDVQINFSQLKEVVNNIKDYLSSEKETQKSISTGLTSENVQLKGTNETEIIKIFGETNILLPEVVTLKKFNVCFVSFIDTMIHINEEDVVIGKNKTYVIKLEYVSNLIGWVTTIQENNYKNRIDIDSLFLWYNSSDYKYLTSDSSDNVDIKDRMHNVDYQSNYNVFRAGSYAIYGAKEPDIESSRWLGAVYDFITYPETGKTVIDDFGIDLPGFVGDEITIEIESVVTSKTSSYANKPIFSLGDKNTTCTNCISMKHGASGYITVYDETGTSVGGINTFAEGGLIYYSVTFSKAEGKVIIYKDGVKQTEVNTGTNMTIGNRLLLGATFDTATVESTVVGRLLLRDLRIYTKVLSEEQIAKHYKVISSGDVE